MCALGQQPAYNLRALKDLADDRWREFEAKTRLEWKVTFALWLALLAAIAGLGRGEFGTIAGSACLAISLPIAILIPAMHFLFLYWVQVRLQEIRKDMWEIYRVRWNAVFTGVLAKEKEFHRDPKRQVTMLVQLIITGLLAVLLIAVAWNCRKPAPTSGPQGTPAIASQPVPTQGELVKRREAGTKP